MNLYLRLLQHIKPYWKVVVLAIITMVITAAMEPLLPALMEPLVDGSLIAKKQDTLLSIPLLILAVFLAKGLFSYISTVASNWVAQKAILDIRTTLFARVNALPLATHQQLSSGTLISKLTFDVPQIASSLSNAWIVLVRDSLVVIGLVAYLFYISWQLSLIIFITVPFFSWVIAKVSKLLRKSNTEVQDAMAQMTDVVEESIHLNKEIKIYNGASYEEKKFNTIARNLFTHLMAITKVSAANIPIMQSLTAVAMAIVLYVASIMTFNDTLTPGQFIAFITAMSLLFEPIRRLTGVNADLQKGMAAAKSIFNLLDEEIERNTGAITLPAPSGEIVFDNVSFAYQDGNYILRHFNATIAAGKTTALVGLSGSGKTTLTQLINHFYSVQEGKILLDGVDIADIELSNLRSHIALVSQEVNLFADDIYHNVAYGDMENASEEKVLNALKQAYAYDFVMALPQGLRTAVGKNGSKLSGGQKQRISLARALLKNAKILILDESTSALDNASEKYIQQAISELQGVTKIIIAHRLSTIIDADTIIVMDKGNIIEEGPHEQLLQQNGFYAKLYHKQLKNTIEE